MRILMLGWEFPPFIAGGLGVACHGLTRALDRAGHEVIFVLPRPIKDPQQTHVRLLSPAGTKLALRYETRLPFCMWLAKQAELQRADGLGMEAMRRYEVSRVLREIDVQRSLLQTAPGAARPVLAEALRYLLVYQHSIHHPDWSWITVDFQEGTQPLHPYAELLTFWDNPKFPDPLGTRPATSIRLL